MAEIGRIQTNQIPWPSATHAVKPAGEQQRQPKKEHQQQDEHSKRDDEDGFDHIDEYA